MLTLCFSVYIVFRVILCTIVANYQNLIPVSLSSNTGENFSLGLLNAQSVGSARKRAAINDFILEHRLDLFFITETWLRKDGDEPKCLDLCPPAYTAYSFPRLTRGGGIAVVISDCIRQHVSYNTTFPFDHETFELCHTTINTNFSKLHIFCIYRPPPSQLNRLSSSLFVTQFTDLLEFTNTLGGLSIIFIK